MHRLSLWLLFVGFVIATFVVRRMIRITKSDSERIRLPLHVYQTAPVSLSNKRQIVSASPSHISDTVEDLMQRLVILTAISDNHFKESQGMLSSVAKCLPHNKIILYNLGLSDSNQRKLKKYRTVEMRRFPLEQYLYHPHVNRLRFYAWKPVILKNVSQEYDVIMYGDASMRMKSCNIEEALSRLFHFPFFAAVPFKFIAVEFAHDGMLEYLHYPKARKDLANMYSIEATGFLIWADDVMKEKLLEPWLDCALHEECIAPVGAKLGPCNFTMADNHNGDYIGCHRYDQAALDLILAREFGTDSPRLSQSDRRISTSIWEFKRLH